MKTLFCFALAFLGTKVFATTFTLDGRPVPALCADYLSGIERKLGRALTAHETFREIPRLLVEFDETLGPLDRHVEGFDGSGRIHAPAQDAAIFQLAVGDSVFSWEENSQRLIVNTVSAIHVRQAEEVFRVGYRALYATKGAWVFDPSQNTYRKFLGMEQSEDILVYRRKTLLRQALGQCSRRSTCPVVNVELAHPPYNLILEGVITKSAN